MLIFHETEEIIIGDIPEFEQEDIENLQEKADIAVSKIFSNITNLQEYVILIDEFNKRETKEAQFAYMCDKLEHIILVKMYEEEGCNDLKRFSNKNILKDPKIKNALENGATKVVDIFSSIAEAGLEQ